ncbi:MAG: hypothetical protein KGJ78_02140 [Alphaproteobacteria bacterium]|nr:hypothetical protein [Alphaproteobacteria bacterium]
MKDVFTRRNILIGAGGVAAVAGAVVGGRYVFRKRYAPSPYDDLLAKLNDRDAAAQLGESVLADSDDFDAKAVADDVRARLQNKTLVQATAVDAGEGRVMEAGGWILPETLALLCALAAKAAS